MANTTITSANSVLILGADIFPVPIQIKGFASDKAFAVESLDVAEVVMGVDGIQSAGYIPTSVKQTISLQADSPSKLFFSTLWNAMKSNKEVYYLSGTLTLPSTGEAFSLNRGILSTTQPFASAQKTLQSMDFTISWESVTSAIL